MSRLPLLALLLLPCGGCESPQHGPEYIPRSAFEFLLGVRVLDSATYGNEVDDQAAFGFTLYTIPNDWPVELEFSFQYSGWDDGDYYHSPTVEGSNLEFSAGLRRVFGPPDQHVRPYLGGGVAWVDADLDDRFLGVSGSDTSFGYYLHAGIVMPMSGMSYWGLDYRVLLDTEIDLGFAGDDGDYYQLSIFWGFAF